MVCAKQGVRDRGAGRVGDDLPSGRSEGHPVGLEVGRRAGALVHDEIPAVDQHVSLPANLANHDVEAIHVVATDLVLAIVVDRREGGQHEVGLARLAGGIRDPVEITAEIRDPAGRSSVAIRFRPVPEIRPTDRDVDHMGAEAMKQVHDSSGDLAESDEGFIAPDHGRAEGGVDPLESFDDRGTEIAPGLVGDQQHQSSIVTIDHVPSVG